MRFLSNLAFHILSEVIFLKKRLTFLKVHFHAIQCFYVDFFFAVENGGEDTRGHGAHRVPGLGRNFFPPVRSFAIDRRRSISQLPLQSHSSLSRTKLGFEIWSRK